MLKLKNSLSFIRLPVGRECACKYSSSNKLEITFDKPPANALQSREGPHTQVAEEKYEPNKVATEELRWRTPWHQKEGQYHSFLRVFYTEKNRRSTLQRLQTQIDLSPSAIKKWWAKKKEESEIVQQAYLPERNQILGNELAAAHFIVARGGAVKFFNHDEWVKADERGKYDLPRFYEEGWELQAIDCADMPLYYEGLVNLYDLRNVEWLSLNGCENMDDWCVDRITNQFSHSLIYLDLRNCPNISARGIGCLYKLQKLKILYLDDFMKSTVYEYTCLLLEEIMPNLEIRSNPVTFEIK
ncbi:unnamed protein product [Acanthoscelides obtectus]|uniref:ATP synthase subunit s-like protein n=1 Tax=Acanthoscelides obtectus TaxID=200917 RepID=A0A9P0KJM9_ACAOB|nr:unnamed protein product [Acanthoscelides obtectus]CAK1664996.1 Distal membrane-arm assembly complex protein 2 [Acanthoscelides obtectus]